MFSQKKEISTSPVTRMRGGLLRAFILGAPLSLFLTACHSDFGPFPMASGYKHHNEEYKAPPGGEPILEKIDHMEVPQSVDGPAGRQAHKTPEFGMPQGYRASPEPGEPRMKESGTKDAVPLQRVASRGTAPVVVSHKVAPPRADHAANELITRLVATMGLPNEAVYIRPPSAGSRVEADLASALHSAMAAKGFVIARSAGQGPFTLHYAASELRDVGTGDRLMVTASIMGGGSVLAEESGIYGIDQIMIGGTPMAAHKNAPVVEAMPAPPEPGEESTGAPTPIYPE